MKQFSPKPSRRLVIHSKDIEEITGFSPRGARNYLLNLKKRLGKARDEFLFVHELCELLNIEEEKIRSLMRMPLLLIGFLLFQIYLFRDDMDLWFIWVMDYWLLRANWMWFRHITNQFRLLLLNGSTKCP